MRFVWFVPGYRGLAQAESRNCGLAHPDIKHRLPNLVQALFVLLSAVRSSSLRTPSNSGPLAAFNYVVGGAIPFQILGSSAERHSSVP